MIWRWRWQWQEEGVGEMTGGKWIDDILSWEYSGKALKIVTPGYRCHLLFVYLVDNWVVVVDIALHVYARYGEIQNGREESHILSESAD